MYSSQNTNVIMQLKKAKIAHDYEEFEGGHEWKYWQEHIKKSLMFFLEN